MFNTLKENYKILAKALENKEPIGYITSNAVRKILRLKRKTLATYNAKLKLSLDSGYNIYLNKLNDQWLEKNKKSDLSKKKNKLCFVLIESDSKEQLKQSQKSIKNHSQGAQIITFKNANAKNIIDRLKTNSNNNNWYIILRAGDQIYPWASEQLLHSINQVTEKKTIIFDHDIKQNEFASDPHLKPFFNRRFLFEYDYIQNAICISHRNITSIDINATNIFETIYLWILDQKESSFSHIQIPLISQGLKFTKNHKCLRSKIKPIGIKHIEEYSGYQNVKFDCTNSQMVSIIIPFRDKPELLKTCVESILKLTTYPKFEIILADNNSSEVETMSLIKRLTDNHKNIHNLNVDSPFNFSLINNQAVKIAEGELLLFLNNDTEILHKNWLENMVSEIEQKDVGAVGPILLYEDGTVQHAGVVAGIGHVAGHVFRGFAPDKEVTMHRLQTAQEVSAVTGACLLTKKTLFEKVGGFDQTNLKIAYNDIDYCLKLLKLGKKIIFTPLTTLTHFESKSRKFDLSKSERERYDKEVNFMLNLHQHELTSNQFYHPAYSRYKEDYSFNTQL